MLFEDRTGPHHDPAVDYPSMQVPRWWREAKFGIFIHWGIYSVPAWASATPAPPGENDYAHHAYAEWYANTVRISGSPTAVLHRSRYGEGTTYEDLVDLWDTSKFDPEQWMAMFADAGARYVIPVTKHHDGFCLWPTETTSFNGVRRGPRRDIVGDLHDAARDAGLRFGVYYSGAHDWHVADFAPITSDRELFAYRRNDADFAAYCASQLRELMSRYRPDVIWNDIEWPDAGKSHDDNSVAALWRDYLATVPDGTVNDRWGVPAHGFLTREYTCEGADPGVPWEATRGFGRSFGVNTNDDTAMSGADLIRLLATTVARGGNLLLNVGPTCAGTIPAAQAAALATVGTWLRTNGEAIYSTESWHPPRDVPRALFTARGSHRYLIADPCLPLQRPDWLASTELTWLATGQPAAVAGEQVTFPDAVRDDPLAVLHWRQRS